MGRRRITCSIGSSGRDLHASIPEWQHVRLLRHRILSERLLFAHPAMRHNHPSFLLRRFPDDSLIVAEKIQKFSNNS